MSENGEGDPSVTSPPPTQAEQQRANWNHLSARWDRWHDAFETGAAAVTGRLVEMAGVRPGDRVLDLGTGTGEPAITLGRVVGAEGHVTSLDSAAEMTGVARARAGRSPGGGPVEFVTGEVDEAGVPPASLDAVVSRFTLMLLPERDAVLRSLAGLMRPGATLAASVWTTPPESPIIALGFGKVGEVLEMPPPPPPGAPGPFAMSDPEAVAAELHAAGLTDVAVERLTMTVELDSPAELADFLVDLLPLGVKSGLEAAFGTPRPDALLDRIAEAGERFREDGRVRVPSVCLCLRARTP